ncbi:carboxymuconolactone decarboxylase family protein [Sphingosinicella soli]|uniref:4-carboxymuconolactone decarboxylase n=1 Tax=Sphingosinicella soli TaxID=333708 RepID=A0A7W7B414_9SPHN|nr:carboxymuconolactone decarboxylase family protein [Sphingosinicella soli]MBB4632670.1 4-carboxymuconolactone decarboxylase [Sphingosinicella soli]
MDEDRQKKGKAMFDAVYGGITAIPEDSEDDPFITLMLDNLFAQIWSRDAMSIRDRRLVIIGIAAAMGEEFIFETQARAALTKGELTRDQIQEIVLLLTQYVGYPRASRLRARVLPLLSDRDG